MRQFDGNPFQAPSMERGLSGASSLSDPVASRIVFAFSFATLSAVFAAFHVMPLFLNPVITLTWYVWLSGILPIGILCTSAITASAIECTASREMKMASPLFLYPSLFVTGWIIAATTAELWFGYGLFTWHYLLLCALRVAMCGIVWLYMLATAKRRRAMRMAPTWQ